MSRFGTLGTQFFDGSGDPLVDGLINVYESGTFTRKTTYKDVNLTIPNTNPIVLTGDGRLPADVYYSGVIDLSLTTSSGVSVQIVQSLGAETEGQLTDWTATTIYDAGDYVIGSDGNIYKSITSGNQGSDPTSDTINWTQEQFIETWNTSVTYAVNDIVQGSDGFLYVCLVAGSGNDPISDDGTNWGPVKDTAYTTGDTVLTSDITKYTETDWLLCDGSALDTVTYTALAAKLGYNYPLLSGQPNTAPGNSTSNTYGPNVTWTAADDYLAVTNTASPYIDWYARSGDTFTKQSNPASLPTSAGRCIAFSPDGVYLALGMFSSPYFKWYSRSGSTLTALTNPGDVPPDVPRGIGWTSDSTYLAVGTANAGGFIWYSRSGSTLTKLTDPTDMPNGAYGCAWDPTDTYLAVSNSATNKMIVYKRSGTTLTKIADPATAPSGDVVCLAWDSTGTYLAVGMDDTPYLEMYKINTGTDVLTKLDALDVIPNVGASGVRSLDWDDDKTLYVGSAGTAPYIEAYVRNGDTMVYRRLNFDLDNYSEGIKISNGGEYMALRGNATAGQLKIGKREKTVPDLTGVDATGNVQGYIKT